MQPSENAARLRDRAERHRMEMPAWPGVDHDWVELPTGVRLHVARAGPTGGTPVLALHGWPQHWWMWRGVIGPLAADGFEVICPDLRGMGWSGWPADGDFAKQRLADDALALLDVLGIASTHLLGHDWGGWVGFLLARRAPQRVRRLLVCSIVAPWERAAISRRDLAFAYQPLLAAPVIGPALVRETGLVAELMRRASARSYSWQPLELAAYVDAVRTPSAARASSLLYRSFLAREAVSRSARSRPAAPLRMPVLQLVGTEDLVRGRLGAAHRPHDGSWTLELVPGCGHFMLDERPALVADRARSFLADA